MIVESQFDMATGLPTRASLEQSVEQRCDKTQAARSLVYVDIDGLHVCNEKLGFELGDELIVRVADLLTSGLFPPDALLGRISGDRFAVVLENCEPHAALGFTSQLQQAASRIVIGPADEVFDVSLSCGIAALVDMPRGFARALAAAEVACKAAKDRGRNRTELYACEDSSMMRRHNDVIVVGQLREAIRKEQLILYGQKIVRLDRERTVCGFEVLLRWRDPQGQIVGPDTFMSAAQRYQLLPQIDRYVVRHALSMLAPYRNMLMEMKATASINISGQSLGDESFINYLLAELATSHVPPGVVTCEITEQTAAASLARSAELMHQLRRAGCKVALDDFGIGANTLASLKALPATRIKIDGSFVQDMLTNPRSVTMIKSVVSLAREFQMDCVAEYVESEALAGRLQDMGVDHAQGYAFGRPEPLEHLLQTMRSEESQRLRAYWLEA